MVRVRLPPLTVEAVRELAEPHDVDGDDLHARTGGNPFYVTEVLVGAARRTIPATVRDAVLARAAAPLRAGARAARRGWPSCPAPPTSS